VKRLEEEAGIVTGYVAVLAAERMGLSPTAYLNEDLEQHTERHKRNPIDLFRAAVQTWPAAVECAPCLKTPRCRRAVPDHLERPQATVNSLHGVLAVTLAPRSALNISAARAASADTFCCHDA